MYAVYVGRSPGYIVDQVTQNIILYRNETDCARPQGIVLNGGYPSQVQCDWLLSRQ